MLLVESAGLRADLVGERIEHAHPLIDADTGPADLGARRLLRGLGQHRARIVEGELLAGQMQQFDRRQAQLPHIGAGGDAERAPAAGAVQIRDLLADRRLENGNFKVLLLRHPALPRSAPWRGSLANHNTQVARERSAETTLSGIG
jgi:hypothetical protein